MSPRLSHAVRFALPTLVTVLLAATAYEVVRGLLRGPAPRGLAGVTGALPTWAAIAAVLAGAVFLMRLSDVSARPPSWGFAWLEAAWVAVATVVAMHALERGRGDVALVVAVAAALLWVAVHRRIPGWPGSSGSAPVAGPAGAADRDDGPAGPAAEPDLR